MKKVSCGRAITLVVLRGWSLDRARFKSSYSPLLRTLQNASEVLKALGGTPSVEREGDKLIIRSGGCPLAAAVVEHPEVCELAETLVAELVGLPVRESCQRGESPKCRFEIGESE